MSEFDPTTRAAANVSLARRQVLAAGVLLAAGAAGLASAAGPEHAGHAHGGAKKYDALREVAHDCLKTGQACLAHCVDTFKNKDTSLAECAQRVEELLATCTMMSQLAAFNSRHLKSFLTGCIDVCNDCERECRKHEKKHAVCKACGDSCAACVKEMKPLLGKA
jgi:Cys-rich four helix bundle protein (predicted Tat secretion target)